MANRLAQETSPYLLQHSQNPVDWYPWGEEALARAQEEDKPILLSIGYSACHWCHVMERESFEDEVTAAVMNGSFVNIKVDREERPDIDSIYMRAVQASVGRGGWPLTAFLTPDGRFFYGGTYFPPEPRHGMPSFRQVLTATHNAYMTRKEEIEEGANQLLAVIRGIPGPEVEGDAAADASPNPEVVLASTGPETLDQAALYLASQFHRPHGGFGPAPKFPQPVTLEFLLRYFHRTGKEEILQMVLTTLRAMARGGMRDHLGGGFHRYSVDDQWLVPHFEKMLYDNGLLARVYLHAYQITRDPEFKEIVTSTLDYLLDDLRDPEGGFYSARDADSEGEEGLFYVWRPQEISALLGKEEGELFSRVYDVTSTGNFEGQSILHLARGLESFAEAEGISVQELRSRLERSRALLVEARKKREHPFRDEKVLVGWNSFTVRAFAEAGRALEREDYVEAARKTGGFLLEAMREDGKLLRSWKDGDSRIPAFLEDYAGLGNALLALYEATLDPRWLQEAKEITQRTLDLFWEEEDGLFFDSARDGEALVVRPREVMDNATPSGNSLAAELLLRVSALCGIEEYRSLAVRTLIREGDAVRRFPSAFGRLLSALSMALVPPLEVVLVGSRSNSDLTSFLTMAQRDYLPSRVIGGGDPTELQGMPLLKGREAEADRTTAYVCSDFSCTPAIRDVESLGSELTRTDTGGGETRG